MPTGKQFTRGSFGKEIGFQGMVSYELLLEYQGPYNRENETEIYGVKPLPSKSY